jgi:hypothetical protein
MRPGGEKTPRAAVGYDNCLVADNLSPAERGRLRGHFAKVDQVHFVFPDWADSAA